MKNLLESSLVRFPHSFRRRDSFPQLQTHDSLDLQCKKHST